MINLRSSKWGYGLVASIAFGLSSCQMMDGSSSERVVYAPHHQEVMKAGSKHSMAKDTATKKVSAHTVSKAPAQKSGPGPKRAAAPQLPVIQ